MTDFNDDTWTETTRLTPVEKAATECSKFQFLLTQLNGEKSPQTFTIDQKAVTLGRSNEADIQIPSPTLSRKHILITRRGEECCVEDLQSSNGFFLNGVKIHSAVLRNGDTLQLGNIMFSFQEVTQ